MFGLPGGSEWIFIGLIALLLFGKRLPEVMRSLGKGITEFKRGMREVTDEMHRLTDINVDETSSQPMDSSGPNDGEAEDDLIDEDLDDDDGDYEHEDEGEIEEEGEEKSAERAESGEAKGRGEREQKTPDEDSIDILESEVADGAASVDARDSAEDKSA